MSPRSKPADRRYFVGGSDARVIMGDDEVALLRARYDDRDHSFRHIATTRYDRSRPV